MDWGPERYGPIGFVVGGAALASVAVGVALCCRRAVCGCFDRLAWPTRLMLVMLGGAGVSVFASVWAHFVPCMWLLCDGGYGDNKPLRLSLLAGTGPVSTGVIVSAWVLHERRRERAKAVVGVTVTHLDTDGL